MATSTQPKINDQVGNMKEQYFLLLTATRDPHLARTDLAILAEISDSYVKKYGDTWVGYASLAAVTGVTERQVSRAVTRLRDGGWLSVRRRGNRGHVSRYVPNYKLVCEIPAENVAYSEISLPDKNVVILADHRSSTSGSTADYRTDTSTDSYLPDRPTKAGPTVSNNESTPGVALPPPGTGLNGPGPAVPPVDRFKQLWRAYGVRKKTAESRAAYEKLNPDAELHAQLVAAARAWRSRYDEVAWDETYRKALSTWLEHEHYEDDPRLAINAWSRPEPKGAKKAPAVASPEPRVESQDPIKPPPPVKDKLDASITSAVAVQDGSTLRLAITFTGEKSSIGHTVISQHDKQEVQAAGHLELARLCFAAGRGAVDRVEELVGLRVTVLTSNGSVTGYEPIPVNDNRPQGRPLAVA